MSPPLAAAAQYVYVQIIPHDKNQKVNSHRAQKEEHDFYSHKEGQLVLWLSPHC